MRILSIGALAVALIAGFSFRAQIGAATVSSPSAALKVAVLTINGDERGTFYPTQSWTLSLTGAPPSTPFDLCYAENVNHPVCLREFSVTNSSGSWVGSGVFGNNAIGAFTEWVRFPSNAVSTRISFLVLNRPSVQAMINGQNGGSFAVGQAWTVAVTSPNPNAPFTICTSRDENAEGCFDGGFTDFSGKAVLTGTFANSAAAKWRLWVRFPDGESNVVAFDVTQGTPPRLSLAGQERGDFIVGQKLEFTLSGAPGATPFDLCYSENGRTAGCVPNFGVTDQSGSFVYSRQLGSSSLGNWSLWAKFGSGQSSSWISFTVHFPVQRAEVLDIGFYVAGQDPNQNIVLSEDQIRQRLAIIAPFAGGIRTYGSTRGLENVARIAREEFGLQTYIGSWIDENFRNNDLEIANLVKSMKAGHVTLAIVGSEVMYRGDRSENVMLGYVDTVKRGAPDVPVSTADTIDMLLRYPRLAAASDVLLPNVHPYWMGYDIKSAINVLHFRLRALKARYPGKGLILSETGWPSAGQTIGNAVASAENASEYFMNFISYARAEGLNYSFFVALDEDFKRLVEGPAGAHWGIFDQFGTLKPGMMDTFLGKTIPDNWSIDAVPPTIPTNVKATAASSTSVDVVWTASNDNDVVKGYKIYSGQLEAGAVTGTTYRITGLLASTNYAISVAAYDQQGNLSPRSNTIAVRTLDPPRDTVAPAPPTSVTATAVAWNHIRLAWIPAVDRAQPGAEPAGIAAYQVYKGNTLVATTPGTTTSYDDTVDADSDHSYRLRALDAAGNLSGFSGTASASTPCRPDPLGGPGTPSIQFTSVPARFTSANLAGSVSHVGPSEHYVAVFIFVPNWGWYNKPTWAGRKTAISCSGVWGADITTGGTDSSATQIVAYLFKSTYDVPSVGDYSRGGAALPAELDANAVAKVQVTR